MRGRKENKHVNESTKETLTERTIMQVSRQKNEGRKDMNGERKKQTRKERKA